MPETQLNVRLLSHTPDPVTAIALAGRLCYSDSDILSLREGVRGRAPQFVEKLASLGHLSPFEHASFTFGAEGVSRALLAQITRHRVASFSVQSQRYVKQNGGAYLVPPSVAALGEEAVARFEAQMDAIWNFYGEWLAAGIPAEDARFVLPNAAETRMVFTMNAPGASAFLLPALLQPGTVGNSPPCLVHAGARAPGGAGAVRARRPRMRIRRMLRREDELRQTGGNAQTFRSAYGACIRRRGG